MKELFFDESGNTGQNLSDLSQPVFTLAATSLEKTEAEQLLAPFAVLNQKEIKYSKLRKTGAGQRLVLKFLKDSIVNGTHSKIYVVHKPFMVVSKIVDMIYEPQLHGVGENFYRNKAALATANLLVTVMPVFAGRTRFYRALELFVKAVRSKDAQAIQQFFRDVQSMHDHIEQKHGKDNALPLVPILFEQMQGGGNLVSANIDELDPIVPAFKVHADHWSKLSPDRFIVVSDDSSTLQRNQQVFLDYSDPDGTPVTADYHGYQISYPLKIDAFRFVDSATAPSVRIADLLAGVAADAFAPRANQEEQSEYQKALQALLFEKELILNAIWPSDDVTPESLNATGESSVDPVDVSASFLKSVREKKNR